MALSLHKHFRGKSLALGLILVPMMLAPMVMGMFWNLIFDGNYGILNQLLAAIGLGEPQWTTDNSLKLLSIFIGRHLDVDTVYDADCFGWLKCDPQAFV